MKKTPVYLSLAIALVLTACATSKPSTSASEEPSTARPVSPTETLEPPAATELPSTATREPAPEPSSTETTGDEGQVEEVIVIDSTYRLKVTNVPVGTTVTWVYDAGLPHTVTSDTNIFNSGTMGEGDTFSFTFDEAGTFPYFCRFHGSAGGNGMSGVVNVTDG
jgi:plastocyanin